uniref:Neuroguidin n=1 Tax=Angiostrongylus cantonensis TaxID=6313 RepID=A0A158P6U8_ANGCA
MVDEETSLKFAQVVRECSETSAEAVETAEKLVSYLRSADKERDVRLLHEIMDRVLCAGIKLPEFQGISLLDVKNCEMLAYMTELSLLMGHMSCGKSIKENPSVFRAAKHRTILESIRPIEQKMRSQIDRLIQGVHTGEVKAPLRCFVNKTVPKKYVPPKMMAVKYEDEHNHQQTKAMEKAKRRALQSSLIQELKQQYSDAPEEFREKNIRKYKDDKEREAYEEDNFVRLRMTKAQKKREQRLNRDNALEDLFNFGNYMMRDESGEALSSNKKRKSSQADGPRKKKSRLERKKNKKIRIKTKVVPLIAYISSR